jgi:hypothetical protein
MTMTATPSPLSPSPTSPADSPPPSLTPTASPTRAPTLTPTPAPTLQPLGSLDDVEIDTAYGSIEARFTGTTGQLVILIGENHASYKVQENVAFITEGLLSTYDIPLLLIEGYGEAIDTSFFDAIPDPAVRRDVAWAFLQAHAISGIEYAALVGGPNVETIGVENMDLWQESKTAIDNELDVEDPVVQQSWETLIERLVAVMESLEYTTELDNMVNDYVEEKIDLVELYEYVLETAAAESVSTTALETAYEKFQDILNPVIRIAGERDPYMMDNTLEEMGKRSTDVAILLIGHAHFEDTSDEGGLSALLEDSGVSYVYILPHGTEDETTEEENQYYEDQLNEVLTAFEVWLNDLFKPKPSIARPSRRAELEVVGEAVLLESLAQAGVKWDELRATHADWLFSGAVPFEDTFDVGGKFRVHAYRARGKKSNETFAVTTSASGSEPKLSHEDDVIYRWQVGDVWVTAVKGRSADILIRRGIVAKQSEPGRTFAFPYEINGGEGIAWQVGHEELVIPNFSWETFNDLLDPEMPVEDREAKIETALGGAGQPPLGGGDGTIIIFPDAPGNVPEDENARAYEPGGDDYNKGRYFRPSYDDADDWSLDWHALAIMLKQALQRPISVDGDPEAAKKNLDRRVPVSVDNLGVYIVEGSLSDEQKQYTDQIQEEIESTGAVLADNQISSSLDRFPELSNVLFITAENDQQLEEHLTNLGERDLLKDKYVVLLTCGDVGLREFSDWAVKEFDMTGLYVYRDKIHANTLPIIIGEAYTLAQKEGDLSPEKLMDEAVKRALERELGEDLERNMERLQNGWDQLSREPGLQQDELLAVQAWLAAQLLG